MKVYTKAYLQSYAFYRILIVAADCTVKASIKQINLLEKSRNCFAFFVKYLVCAFSTKTYKDTSF